MLSRTDSRTRAPEKSELPFLGSTFVASSRSGWPPVPGPPAAASARPIRASLSS